MCTEVLVIVLVLVFVLVFVIESLWPLANIGTHIGSLTEYDYEHEHEHEQEHEHEVSRDDGAGKDMTRARHAAGPALNHSLSGVDPAVRRSTN